MKGRWQLHNGVRVFTDADGYIFAVILRHVKTGYVWFSGLDSGWCRTISACRNNIAAAWLRQKGGAR
jgi:hypothetical protein